MTDGGFSQAVILVGGRGTRLGDMTRQTPKPLLSVGGRPFIEYWLDALAAAAFTDIILACGYLSEQFVCRYDQRQWGGASLRCVVEETPAGTGGVLSLLRADLQPRFVLLNGDSFLMADWNALARGLGTDATQRLGALTLIPPPRARARYGAVLQNSAGDVVGFAEKTSAGGRCNGGVYALHSQISTAALMPSSLESDILPMLAAKNMLGGVNCESEFIDIGVPEDYARAQTIVPRLFREMTSRTGDRCHA